MVNEKGIKGKDRKTRFPNGKILKVDYGKLIFPILFLIVVIIIFLKLSELQEIFQLFSQAKWIFLVLAWLSQMLNIFFQGQVFQSVFKILKVPRFKVFKMMKIMVTVVFLNFAIPSLSFAGNYWLYRRISKTKKISEGRAVLSIILEAVCYYFGFAILIIASGVYLFSSVGKIGTAQKIAAIVFLGAVFLILSTIYYFFGNKKRFQKKAVWFLNKLERTRKNQKKRTKRMVEDFYNGLEDAKKNKLEFFKPVTLQLVKFLIDALTITLIFLAFGQSVVFGVALVAFTFGRLLSIITFIPGGVGSFEGAMILILTSLGTPLELSLSVTLVYRFFSYWLYFPFGLAFAKSKSWMLKASFIKEKIKRGKGKRKKKIKK